MTAIDFDDGHSEALLAALARTGRDESRREEILSELVHMYTPLARHLVRRYARHGEPAEDIEQAAMLGLVKAVNRFDPALGQRFVAYATPTMIGEIKRHFRDRTWSMRMPRRLQDLRLSLRVARQDFMQVHGRAPTVREVSEILGVSEEEAVEAIGASDAYHPLSLDVPVADDADETIGDLIGGDDPEIDTVVDRNSVRPLLATLPYRERTILLHRFFGNKTQSEIAELMQLSQMHISRLISRSLAQLRSELTR